MIPVKTIMKIVGKEEPGPSPTFSVSHVISAFLIMGLEGAIGRKKLSQKLNVGEGVARTIIKRLEKANLLKVTRHGCQLTSKGLKVYSFLVRRIGKIAELTKKIEGLTIGRYHVGILIRKRAHLIKKGVEQRDAAVRVGANGAITLVYSDNSLQMPQLINISASYPRTALLIENIFEPENGDVVIIAGGESLSKARQGAIEAAWTLIKEKALQFSERLES